MINVLILAADAYRMIDTLRDYADMLDTEPHSETMALLARHTADTIENGSRQGGLIEVTSTDRDIAHSAVIGVIVDRREQALSHRAKAVRLEDEADRLERLLDTF